MNRHRTHACWYFITCVFLYTYMLFQPLNGIHKYVHIHTKQKEPAYAYRHEIKAFIHAKDMNNQ